MTSLPFPLSILIILVLLIIYDTPPECSPIQLFLNVYNLKERSLYIAQATAHCSKLSYSPQQTGTVTLYICLSTFLSFCAHRHFACLLIQWAIQQIFVQLIFFPNSVVIVPDQLFSSIDRSIIILTKIFSMLNWVGLWSYGKPGGGETVF